MHANGLLAVNMHLLRIMHYQRPSPFGWLLCSWPRIDQHWLSAIPRGNRLVLFRRTLIQSQHLFRVLLHSRACPYNAVAMYTSSALITASPRNSTWMASMALEMSAGEALGRFNAGKKGRRTLCERKSAVVKSRRCYCWDVVGDEDEWLSDFDFDWLVGDLEAPSRRTAATYWVWTDRRWRMARSEASLTYCSVKVVGVIWSK